MIGSDGGSRPLTALHRIRYGRMNAASTEYIPMIVKMFLVPCRGKRQLPVPLELIPW